MSKKITGYQWAGIILSSIAVFTWWKSYKNDEKYLDTLRKMVRGNSGGAESYTASDEARLNNLVTIHKNRSRSITPAENQWVESIEGFLKAKYRNTPNAITARDRRMAALVG